MKIKRLAVIVAHPDDEVLGCGGLLLKLKNEVKIDILYLNNGNDLRGNGKVVRYNDQIALVNLKLKSGCLVQNFPSARFDTEPIHDIVQSIEGFLEETEADTILTHDINDLHQDHIAVHKAVLIASRFTGKSKVKNIVTFPVISSSEVNPSWKFNPNMYVDISDVIGQKIKLMEIYEDELNAMSFHRGTEGIRIWAKFYGMRSNMKYAEVYNVLRMEL